jgi:hypothetical protein
VPPQYYLVSLASVRKIIIDIKINWQANKRTRENIVRKTYDSLSIKAYLQCIRKRFRKDSIAINIQSQFLSRAQPIHQIDGREEEK